LTSDPAVATLGERLSFGSGVAPPHEKDPLRRVFVILGVGEWS